jgi:hypothetical protein
MIAGGKEPLKKQKGLLNTRRIVGYWEGLMKARSKPCGCGFSSLSPTAITILRIRGGFKMKDVYCCNVL